MSLPLKITSTKKDEVIDITSFMEEKLPEGEGIVTAFVAHTTCAITTADLDPGTDLDLLDALRKVIPEMRYRHPHDPSHAPDHILSSIIGPSVTIPYRDKKLLLGSWQRVILIELNGPQERRIYLNF